MAYPDEVARVSLIWTPDQAPWQGEQAVTTFHLQHDHNTGNSFNWGDAVQYAAERVIAKLGDAWSNLQYLTGAHYRISGVKVAQLDAQGRTVAEGSASPTADLPLVGNAPKVLPPETSICLSMFGYEPGGFSQHKGRKRGRMYLPYVASTLCSATGVVEPDGMTSVLGYWTTFFNDIQGMHTQDSAPVPAQSSDFWKLVVVSSVGTGLATQVTHLGVDNHFDSQRRRQHQVPATRILSTITP